MAADVVTLKRPLLPPQEHQHQPYQLDQHGKLGRLAAQRSDPDLEERNWPTLQQALPPLMLQMEPPPIPTSTVKALNRAGQPATGTGPANPHTPHIGAHRGGRTRRIIGLLLLKYAGQTHLFLF
jgi:hypothetical protein